VELKSLGVMLADTVHHQLSFGDEVVSRVWWKREVAHPIGAQELERASLTELIHQHVRAAIETAVYEELQAALGTSPYERRDVRRGYRNGVRERTLTGPTGPVALTLPRAILFSGAGASKEWTSRLVRGLISRVGRARGQNAGETADGSGAERRGAEGGSGSVERTEPGAAGGPGPEGRTRPVEEQTHRVSSFVRGDAGVPCRPRSSRSSCRLISRSTASSRARELLPPFDNRAAR
jgi:hypothetical protein